MRYYRFPSVCLKYAYLQVPEILSNTDVYERLSKLEYDMVQDVLGSPSHVLEMGCGLGRMSVFLNWQLKDSSIKWLWIILIFSLFIVSTIFTMSLQNISLNSWCSIYLCFRKSLTMHL